MIQGMVLNWFGIALVKLRLPGKGVGVTELKGKNGASEEFKVELSSYAKLSTSDVFLRGDGAGDSGECIRRLQSECFCLNARTSFSRPAMNSTQSPTSMRRSPKVGVGSHFLMTRMAPGV